MAHSVRDFLCEWYGDSLPTYDSVAVIQVGTAATQLVPVNPRRWALRLTNTDNAIVAIGRDASITMATAWVLLSPGQTLEMNCVKDLDEPTLSWWGISTIANVAVTCWKQDLTGSDPDSN